MNKVVEMEAAICDVGVMCIGLVREFNFITENQKKVGKFWKLATMMTAVKNLSSDWFLDFRKGR